MPAEHNDIYTHHMQVRAGLDASIYRTVATTGFTCAPSRRQAARHLKNPDKYAGDT